MYVVNLIEVAILVSPQGVTVFLCRGNPLISPTLEQFDSIIGHSLLPSSYFHFSKSQYNRSPNY